MRRDRETEIGYRLRRFSDALPVRCAIALRHELAELGIDIRVGIHIGEVEVRGDDFLILRERDIHAVAAKRLEVGGTGLYL